MIVVRDIFTLKFGKSKEATALLKEGIGIIKSTGYGPGGIRILTDLAGPAFYTLIMESTFDSMSQWEQSLMAGRSKPEWRGWYEKVIPFMESGRREILSVIS